MSCSDRVYSLIRTYPVIVKFIPIQSNNREVSPSKRRCLCGKEIRNGFTSIGVSSWKSQTTLNKVIPSPDEVEKGSICPYLPWCTKCPYTSLDVSVDTFTVIIVVHEFTSKDISLYGVEGP